jgi:hypothetical protein
MYFDVMEQMFTHFKLEQYIGCVTGEMHKRPVPHAFKTEETQALVSLYERRAPAILERILTQIKPPLQPLNKQSRLGFPFFTRPDSKRTTLLPYFSKLEELGPEELLEKAFIIMNVRLQAESRRKKRDMLFLADDGTVYNQEVTEKDRTIKILKGEYEKVASRTRLVFNMPAPNLYKQVLDSAIHAVLLEHPAFGHNMYASTGTLPVRGATLCFDVKHFERHTASISRARAKLIGGLYGRIVDCFTKAPFLCPSDTWKSYHMLWPDRAAGWSEQFASGDSAVAPLQKEVFLALYMEVAERILGIPATQSMDFVLQGGDERLTIRNYGDDNSLSGDRHVLDETFSLMKEYLHVEKEDPEKFLGFLWTQDGWRLGVNSYLEKTYLNERAPFSPFRKYPLFGWVEKRKVYQQYGVADLDGKVFPMENLILDQHSRPWSKYLIGAQTEAHQASRMLGAWRHPAWLLGKDWQMTAEEKINTGLYEGLYPAETKPMIRKLLGERWRGGLP